MTKYPVNPTAQIFTVKQHTLYDICGLMKLSRRRTNVDMARDIVKVLQDKYYYFGEYDSRYIREFLKVYNMKITDEIERQEREMILSDLRYGDKRDENGNPVYVVDDERYKQLINPNYRNSIRQRILFEIEQQRRIEQQRIAEEQRRLAEQQRLAEEQRIAEQQRIEQQRRLAEEQRIEEQRIQTINSKNNTAKRIFPNDKMDTPDIPDRSRGRIGMKQLANIVLGLQRDFKRVANALSVQGAQDIVDKHNEKSPHAQWHVTNDDVNDDGIPDIIIRNANNDPIVVNGWTTKGSNYPERYAYYNAYPTREQRKQHPFPDFKRKELYQIEYDMAHPNIHNRGNVARFNTQPFPEGWDTSKYNVNRNPGKRLSAYRRFQELIVNPTLEIIIPEFVDRGLITLNAQGKWSEKMKFTAQVTAKLWDEYIIQEVSRRNNMSPDSKEFRKIKNSANGKQYIDNLVSELYLHLHVVSEQDGWTEADRKNFQDKFIHRAADELYMLVQHAAQIADDQHVYPVYNDENVHAYNHDVDGDFGKPWGT